MKFSEQLRNAMADLHLNQRQVCGMTGCSKASISQYLSGKNLPSDSKKREIASALGLDPDYFDMDGVETIRVIQKGQIEKLKPEEVAKVLGIGKETVRAGLQQGVFPWGYGIRMASGKWVYVINAERFRQIEGIMP